MEEKTILHIDCNSFYASVELLKHPKLKNKPVAVSGSSDNRHGIILAKNEAAKKFNVQTAETIWQAKRKCPDLILLPPHRKEYDKYHKILNDIYAQYSDRVEPFGIDESWIDITGSWHLFGNASMDVAEEIRARVKDTTGLTVSIGVSFNKIFAKLGSDYKKPDAITEFSKAKYKSLVWPLPVSSLLFVGKKTCQSLKALDIQTIGELANTNKAILAQMFGKQGEMLFKYANGDDDSPVAKIGEYEPVKSIGNGLTFKRNLVGERDIRTGIGALSDEVATRLRKHNIYATTVQIMIKNTQLKSITRQKQLKYATDSTKDITQAGMELMREHWDFTQPVRMLTVTAMQLTDTPFAVQTSFFEEVPTINPKTGKLERSIDSIRDKFGQSAILSAGELHNDIGLQGEARPDEDTGWLSNKNDEYV